MGLYIRGMEMPKNCASCKIEQEVAYADETGFPYIGAHRCPLVYPSYTDESRYKGLLPNCPLAPVPPHGKLIDANAMIVSIKKQTGFLKNMGGNLAAMAEILEKGILQEIENAPTIIEAEEGET